jgi:hypothetical protein
MFKAMPDLLRAPNIGGPLEHTLQEIDRAVTAAAVERIVMAYASTRWSSALLARIDGRGDTATGMRGHGTERANPTDITVPLAPDSALSLAYTSRRIVLADAAPATAAQTALTAALSGTVTAAAPVIVAGEVPAVLVVGAPLEIPNDDDADLARELDRLVDALGAAYDRFARS